MATTSEVLVDFWPDFSDETLFPEVECEGAGTSLAAAVLNEFDVAYDGGEGGNLTDLDIKRMDALTVIKWSLLEYSADNNRGLMEPIVNSGGQVEFIEVGAVSGNITDVYYSLQTGSWREPCKGALVTGGRPRPIRKEIDWKPIWGEEPDVPVIYAFRDMISNCHRGDFLRYATIVFDDPNVQSGYEDGIDNLYELTKDNPWDRIVGYATFKDVPSDLMNDDVTIDYTNTATIPIEIGVPEGTSGSENDPPDIGTLQLLPQFNPDISNPDCWNDPGQGRQVDFEDGVIVEIPDYFRYETVRGTEKDKFIRVSGVYLVGREIDSLWSSPIDDSTALADSATDSDTKIWVTINYQSIKTLQLREGVNYSVAYDGEPGYKQPYIVFSKDVRKNDPADYGNDTDYYLDPFCDMAEEVGENSQFDEGTGTILPISKTRGFMVHQIWVTVDLETPSIVVHDPMGGNAYEIASNMEYYLGPIVVVEPPTPMGFAGRSGSEVVDQAEGIRDHDPTTQQDFEDTRLEDIMDEMQGSGLTINMSFLDEDQVEDMAQVLYNYMATDPGVETVYTCGPNCEPQLGGFGNNSGVVNSIQYSYTDSGAYTISVQEGPYLVGSLTAPDGGPVQKMVEDFGATGTIIEDLGNGVHFKIRIDDYGERWGISLCHNILRVGDRVSCTVHNNPVEA